MQGPSADDFIKFFVEDGEITNDVEESMNFFFNNEQCYRNFLSKSGLRKIIEIQRSKDDMLSLNRILPFIKTNSFFKAIDSFMTEDIEAIIYIIIDSLLPPEQNITLIDLIFQTIFLISRNRRTLIKDLSDPLTRYSEYIKTASLPIVQMFGDLLKCSTEGYSWEIYTLLNKIFKYEACKRNSRLFILEIIADESIWKDPRVAIEDWQIPEVSDSNDFFNAYTRVSNIYISNRKNDAYRIVEFLSFQIAPFPRDTVRVEAIIQYLSTLITDFQLNSEQFGDDKFLNLIIENTTPFNLAMYLNAMDGIMHLLKLILDNKRRRWATELVIDALVQALPHDTDDIIYNFLFQVFSNNICYSIVIGLLRNLQIPKVFEFTRLINSVSPGFQPFFTKYDCFSGLPFDDPVFSMNFLSLMKDYIVNYNCHAFDDWVVEQTSTSKVFQIPPEVLSNFLPENPYDPILFPSLLLLTDFKPGPTLPSNKFLIGFYSIHVAQKLNKKLHSIDNLKSVVSRFIRTSDAFAILKEDNIKSIGLLTHRIDPSLYEFHPRRGKSLITFPSNMNSIAFAIYIDSEIREYPLFTISGQQFIIKNDTFLFHNNKKKIDITPKTWYYFGIFKVDRNIHVYCQQYLIESFSARSIDLIVGSKEHDPGLVFYLSANVAFNVPLDRFMTSNYVMHPSALLIKNGYVTFVPIHSFDMVITKKKSVQKLFDLMLRTHDQDELRTLVSFISQLPLFSKKLGEWFFKKFAHNLVECIDRIDLSLLMIYVACCLSSSEFLALVPRWLSFIVADYRLWTNLNENILKEFVKSLCGTLSHKKGFDWDLFYKLTSPTIFVVMTNSKYEIVMPRLIEFMKVMLNNCHHMNTIQDFLMKIMSFNMLTKFFGKTINNDLTNQMYSENEVVNHMQEEFLFMAISMGENKKVDFLGQSTRLFLSLFMSINISVTLISSIVMNPANDEFINVNINTVARAMQRLANERIIWDVFMSYAIGKPGVLDSNNEIQKPNAYPVFFAMLKTVFSSSDSQLIKSVLKAFSNMKLDSDQILKPPIFSYFIELISFKSPDLKLFESLQLNVDNTEFNIQQIKRNTKFMDFLNLQKIADTDPSVLYIEHISQFLEDLVNTIQSADFNNFMLFMKVLIIYSHKFILNYFVFNFIKKVWNNNDLIPHFIVELLTFILIMRQPEYFEFNLHQMIIERVKNSPHQASNFKNHLIYLIPLLDSENQIELQQLIKGQSGEFMDDILYTLSIIKTKNVFDKFETFENFKNFVKSLVGYDDLIEKVSQIENFDDIYSLDLSVLDSEFETDKQRILSNLDQFLINKQKPILYEIRHQLFVFENVKDNIDYTLSFLKNFYRNLNNYCRHNEKHKIHFYQRFYREYFSEVKNSEDLEKLTKSFFISTIDVPPYFRSIISRSPFPLPHPTAEKYERQNFETFFGLTNFKEVSYLLPEYLPQIMSYSVVFHPECVDAWKQFCDIYKIDNNCTFSNAVFVRVDIREKSLVIKKESKLIILIGAELNDNSEMMLEDMKPLFADSIIQSALIGEFGKCSLFLGRIVIIVDDITLIENYVILSNPNAVKIHSSTCGAFILEFAQTPPIEEFIGKRSMVPNKKEIVDNWKSGKLSTFDFLFMINNIAKRSTYDVNAYPIYPRLLKNLEEENYNETENIRDLSKPVQIVFDPEKLTEKCIKSFKSQKYHHAENLSNSILVCMLNVRFSPFCRQLWELNDGWDRGDRVFRSIPSLLSIKQKTQNEIIPELYFIPEILMNKNSFENMDLEFPKWATSPVDFIEKFRVVLENPSTKENLVHWIDLVFGKKQTGQEAVDSINVFNPLSYPVLQSISPLQQPENPMNSKRHTWMMNCGSVPFKVFNESIRVDSQNQKQFPEISSDFASAKNYEFSIDFNQNSSSLDLISSADGIVYSKLFKYGFTFNSLSVSQNFLYFAVTTNIDRVLTYTIKYNANGKPASFKRIGTLNCNHPKFTVISSKQMIGLTATTDSVILYSLSRSTILNIIDVAANCAAFDDELGQIIIGSGNEILIYTYNATFIRKIQLPAIVCSVLAFGGFSCESRFIGAGLQDGLILILQCTAESHELSVVSAKFITSSPITALEFDGNKLYRKQ